MTKEDYYETLGLQKDASKDEIKKAYKKLAKKYHPDVNKEADSEEKFKKVLEAYKVLSNPEKKSQYDQFGHNFEGFQGGGFQGFNFEDMFDSFEDFGFGDIFGGFGRRGPKKGQDIILKLPISFEEAAFGTEKTISFEKVNECKKCSGKGYEKESDAQTCSKCQGNGTIIQIRRTLLGAIQTRTPCNECKGTGKKIKNICKDCKGNGRKKEIIQKTIDIPAGINSGQHLRIKGMGNAGEHNAQSGDLLILVYVNPHSIFKRDGSDIYMELPIGFAQAALGGKIKVPTLKGEATLDIPTGTQTHTVFRLKGKGIQKLSGLGKGDEFIRVIVKTPKKLSRKQKELLQKLKEEDTA